MTIITLILNINPTTWLEHIETHEDSPSLNKIYNSVVNLLKVTTVDELS